MVFNRPTYAVEFVGFYGQFRSKSDCTNLQQNVRSDITARLSNTMRHLQRAKVLSSKLWVYITGWKVQFNYIGVSGLMPSHITKFRLIQLQGVQYLKV